MKKSLLALVALALVFPVGAGVVPPANGVKMSLTKPTAVTGTDWSLTKSSQVQVKTSSGNITFYVKAGGVIDTTSTTPVTQMNNTARFQLRVKGVNKTKEFQFDLAAGKTNNALTKYSVSIGDTATWGSVLVPGDSIEITGASLIQGGTGPGAGSAFAVAGLTAK